jgi:hypothetical protein
MRIFVVLAFVSVIAFAGCATNQPSLKQASLDQIDQAFLKSNFEMVYTVEALPKKVAEQIRPIANPSEPYNSSDLMDPNLPSRRIVFGGTSQQFVFVLCDQGGFAPYRCLLLFPLFDSSHITQRMYIFQSYVSDFPAVKREIENGRWAEKKDIEQK